MGLRRAARVILIGAPGVGKGTQSERLLARFPQLSAISSGDLLRQNVKTRTPLGIKVESTIKTGGLVSDDLILRLITNELGNRGWLSGGRQNVMTLASSAIEVAEAYEDANPFITAGSRNPAAGATLSAQALEDPRASFLLDGFPRTATQAERLDEIVPMNMAISIKTPFEVIMERIHSRWVHEPSGRVYNTSFHIPKVPGRDDMTGEPLVQRADDDEKIYRSRFQKFQETSEPLLEHYAKKGVLWEVQGMSSDEISPKLYKEFERRFA
ncbi:P-loop containing nucleoside triphosphate hydrolase protein [Pseudomassariella vexata]|uniref:GTP:AMP phosphotransferase, mitochondrial n=1 Tax=Pseudomassariella vexata TaxID=1141098 RepID=A0A1Y2D880_9PEZI|nr:P-loop containing nucleoside triphosphate hydrolase protein [Pseudomassariella vexata]ORY55470.1 P-loop containing nucleoside triphosphate hydrolase protein [Pseudomassariella vexata]